MVGWFSLRESESEMTLTGFIGRGGWLYPLPLSLYPENGNAVWVTLSSSVCSAEKFPYACLILLLRFTCGAGVEAAAVGRFQFAGGLVRAGLSFRLSPLLPMSRALRVAEPTPRSLLHLIPGVQLPSPPLQLRASGCFARSGVRAVVLRTPGVPRPWDCVGRQVRPQPVAASSPGRRMCRGGWETAPSAAAEEGCSAKPRRSKRGEAENETMRLLSMILCFGAFPKK